MDLTTLWILGPEPGGRTGQGLLGYEREGFGAVSGESAGSVRIEGGPEMSGANWPRERQFVRGTLGGIAAHDPGHTDHDIAYLIKLTGDANISNLDGDFMATSLRTPAGPSPLQLLAAA